MANAVAIIGIDKEENNGNVATKVGVCVLCTTVLQIT